MQGACRDRGTVDHRTAAESRPGSGIRVIWPGLRAEREAATPQRWRAEEAAGSCSPDPGECCPAARGRAVLRHVRNSGAAEWPKPARLGRESGPPVFIRQRAGESSPPAAHWTSCLSPAACGRAVPRRAREGIYSQRAGEFTTRDSEGEWESGRVGERLARRARVCGLPAACGKAVHRDCRVLECSRA